MFFKGSRYEKVADLSYTDPVSKRSVSYKGIRYISRSSARIGHIVSAADRLDLIAFRYYQDPLQFWRICDGNLALWPPTLLAAPGAILRVPQAGA